MPSCLPSLPLLILRTVADRQVVRAASHEAAGYGIRAGMTLTQARALCAGVEFAEHDPDRDARALEALARWMMRFSPVVACGTDAEPAPSRKSGATAQDARESESIFLDITGCERLFGGLENVVSRVSSSLSRLGIRARVAAAPTPGAAWALAFAGKDGAIVAPERLEAALHPLPVEALRLGAEISQSLRHLGLTTIGQVMHLPREVLPARFGPVILRRIDQAMGRLPEPLVPLEYRPPIEARLEFDGSAQSLEAIWSAFNETIGRVIEQLVRRGAGARRVDVELLRNYAPPVKREIFLSRPSRDPANLFNLFRCSLEELELPRHQRPKSMLRGRRVGPTPTSGAPQESHVHEEGFSGMRITVPLFERLSDEQILLLDHERHTGQIALDHLIERLCVRLGSEAIVRPERVESYLPEGAWKGSGLGVQGSGFGVQDRMCFLSRNPARLSPSTGSGRCPSTGSGRCPPKSELQILNPSPPRPLHLLSCPTEIRVMVTPSEDAEGNPAAFTHEGMVYPVAYAVGPERIAGRWWDGHDKTRDYFDVADPAGRRFWIFRVLQTGRWFLHGVFE